MKPDFHRVCYKSLIADVKQEHLEQALESLRGMSTEEKDAFMQSVNRALDNVMNAIDHKKKLDAKALQNACDDVGLWFANEVLEGRSEQYKVMLQ